MRIEGSAGIAPRVAQRIMRHAVYRTTLSGDLGFWRSARETLVDERSASKTRTGRTAPPKRDRVGERAHSNDSCPALLRPLPTSCDRA